MPIRYTEDPADIASLKVAPEKFLIFYSSRLPDGSLWCPDCVAVDDVVQKTFGPPDAPSALVVYVGQRPEWKSPSNPFRADPYNVGSIPTIIRVDDGKRLVEGEIDEHSLSSSFN
ncbi:hypothetical protein K474DRAFT_1588315 [Panus rudis PR-1116 ss-1]|nr:hypothetical protein K474DRAFT_1588315 [Panus rudis PR-1116 ss-1]